MNWLPFLSWLAGAYLAYYSALTLSDYLKNKRSPAADPAELTFTEDIQPKKIRHQPDKAESPPKQLVRADSAIIGSGGVSLKSLFGLCREEAVIYTRPVSF